MKKDYPILQLEEFPPLLKEIVDPPKKLFIRGTLPDWEQNRFLTVVGSRSYSAYGKQVCEKLIHSLAGLPVVIVSGLAYGIDAIAHKAALNSGLMTVAVPGSGLDESVLYPRAHLSLAQEICYNGGALISEYPATQKAASWTFPRRNRVMAGMSHATLVIEATQKSGTLITARLATEYNRDVLVVPHDITRETGMGANRYISLGATPICSEEGLKDALGFTKERHSLPERQSFIPEPDENQKIILNVLKESPYARIELPEACGLPADVVARALTELELDGVVEEVRGKLCIKL